MSTWRLRRTGFTLSELLVGLVVTSITVAAVAASVIGVSESYQAETEIQAVTQGGRSALGYLERTVRLAGYGIDPRVGIDVGTVPGSVARNNYTVTATGMTGEVVTDDLAIRYRDPAWLRAGRLNPSNTSLTLDTAPGFGLPVGKRLLVACRGGIQYAVVRVTTAAASGDTTVAVTNAGAPFVNNSNECLKATGTQSPWVFLIQEQRLRIVALGGRPWLVSFRSLDADVTDLTQNNFDPIAGDVETFQVAFGMNRPRTGSLADPSGGNTNWISGDSSTDTALSQPSSALTSAPDYGLSYDDAQRFTLVPANVRAVHLSLVLRSTRVEKNKRRAFGPEAVFDWTPSSTTADGFYRSRFHTAIGTPNLLSRSFFLPMLRSSADLRDLNSWGG